jgi:hypothetical protein
VNTYQPVKLESGRWAIERFVDGESHGFTLGRYEDKAAATHFAKMYARMEVLEETRRPDTA